FKSDFISKHGAHANTILGDTTKPVTANYFVIHDTAATNKATTSSQPANNTGIHMWLNNDGAYQTHDWNHRGDGTKVERANNGCFVHTELVRHPKLDEAVAGVKQADTYYTDLQYELLAYAYVVCSMRKGKLLEVTVHRELDRSIKNGHNDPQHFNMNGFYSLVDGILGMPISKLHPPLRDFTYGIEHSRIMKHRQDNWSGYRNEFIPYVESRVTRAEQYRPIARRRNSAGNVINTDYATSDITMRRRC
ncbi:N-acetylmuramoyl-L-alanine amidase, partial [uncultured Eudoraea sp.]|uniref:N-acetylmuramoyl-L-alanine amidase n=1 Tax=uncultured Eudoraea sp. TaxID=1035614 RepID=UPI00260943B9